MLRVLSSRKRVAATRSIITGPRFTSVVKNLASIVPFVAPEEQERARGRPFAVRLGANENTLGPSPRAVEAMRATAGDCWMYGDPTSHDLRVAVADLHGCATTNVVVGEGIDGLLATLCSLLIGGRKDAVVTTAGTYPTLDYFVRGRGGRVETVPYAGVEQDLDALLARAREVKPKIVYLVNPDNPSGTWRSAHDVEALVEGLPPGTLLVVDEAYAELSAAPLPKVAVDDLRVLRLRTFSKAYGMAGARIGYALGSNEVISAFGKIRNHFGVGRVSQAGALAALGDAPYLEHVQATIAAARDRLAAIAKAHGLAPLPSATNFVTMGCGGDAAFARAVLAELEHLDVFVRKPGGEGALGRCIRVSAGTAEELDFFEARLPRALAAAKAGGREHP